MSTAVLDRALRVDSGSSSISGAPHQQQGRVHLFGEPVPGWRLENPLPICVERDTDGRFVVSDDIFEVHGVGASWDLAVEDYKVALVEFFEITSDGRDDQSRQLLKHLKAYLRRG
jgi:hypothetical protein